MRRQNHYVPELLLKQFQVTDQPASIWVYRLLVEDDRVPEWECRPTSNTARIKDLYTVAKEQAESDDLERWLDMKFESPARDAVLAATSEQRLERQQWHKLIQLYAAQHLRVPAYAIRHQRTWAEEMQALLNDAHDRLMPQLPHCRDLDADFLVVDDNDGFPLRYTVKKEEGGKRTINLEAVTGRKYWAWAVRSHLRPASSALALLQRYKWSVLIAPKDRPWILSDDPASCMMIKPNGSMILDSGWGTPHSLLMLPLSPTHLLFHQVGYTTHERYVRVDAAFAEHLRRCQAASAYRALYAKEKDIEASQLRPRKIDRLQFIREKEAWEKFGSQNLAAERFESAGADPSSQNL